jgi:hypothetical protein
VWLRSHPPFQVRGVARSATQNKEQQKTLETATPFKNALPLPEIAPNSWNGTRGEPHHVEEQQAEGTRR